MLELISTICLLVSTLAHPTTIVCPRGWWAEGVRADGWTTCRLAAPRDCPSNAPCDDGYVPLALSARVWCAPGDHPEAMDDGRTVACKRAR